MNTKIEIVEHFFSIQGEPCSIGRPAYFIRFPGCNLKCTFCDTLYASRVNKGKTMLIKTLINKILASNTKLIIITGGEPLLKWKEICELDKLLPKEYVFEIETNGTVSSQLNSFNNSFYRTIRYNVSPKLSSSGNTIEQRYKKGVLKEFLNEDAIFKFVVKTNQDFNEVNKIVNSLGIPTSKVWIMPEGKTDNQIKKHALQFVNKIKAKGYNLTPRLHIWLYGKKRKV